MKILFTAALVAAVFLHPTAGQAKQAVVRVVSGTVETTGWEKSLVTQTPNLGHWHWEPQRDTVQTLQRVASAGAQHLSGQPHPLYSDGAHAKETTPYIVIRPIVTKQPYISITPTVKKPYINLPKEEQKKTPYIVPQEQKERGPYIVREEHKEKGPYISLPEHQAQKQTYIKLYEQPDKRDYIKLSGKMMPPHNSPYIKMPPPDAAQTSEHLAGKLQPASPPDRETNLRGKLTPSVKQEPVAAKPQTPQAKAPAPIVSETPPEDTEFAAAWSSANSRMETQGSVAGHMLISHRAPASQSAYKRH
ncbi:MAG TPA: hypothetical protein V6C81_04370 [Planktothrix sp.]